VIDLIKGISNVLRNIFIIFKIHNFILSKKQFIKLVLGYVKTSVPPTSKPGKIQQIAS